LNITIKPCFVPALARKCRDPSESWTRGGCLFTWIVKLFAQDNSD
jgi:hypothetical protein